MVFVLDWPGLLGVNYKVHKNFTLCIIKHLLRVVGSPTFAVSLCVCYNVYNCDDIVYYCIGIIVC